MYIDHSLGAVFAYPQLALASARHQHQMFLFRGSVNRPDFVWILPVNTALEKEICCWFDGHLTRHMWRLTVQHESSLGDLEDHHILLYDYALWAKTLNHSSIMRIAYCFQFKQWIWIIFQMMGLQMIKRGVARFLGWFASYLFLVSRGNYFKSGSSSTLGDFQINLLNHQ